MKLKQLINESKYSTDKFTGHGYLDTYDRLFEPITDSVKNVLEVGIQKGESVLLWRDLFPNAYIYGADIKLSALTINADKEDRVSVSEGNAYTTKFMDQYNDIKFDVIIDDGSHLIEDMVWFVKHYWKLLAPNGIMVVEDIAASAYDKKLIEAIPSHLKDKYELVDMRKKNNRWD